MRTLLGKHKNIVKTIAFSALLCTVFFSLQPFFGVRDYTIYAREEWLSSEELNHPDAVYVGSSQVFRCFLSPYAWRNMGTPVFSYSFPSLPASALKYKIIEARKSHPDALYIINLDSFKGRRVPKLQDLHNAADYMPFSINKMKMIIDMYEHKEDEQESILEYFFPILRFHSGWDEMTENDFIHPVYRTMGATQFQGFLEDITDNTRNLTVYEPDPEEEHIRDEEILRDLLEYIKAEDVKALFVTLPLATSRDTVTQTYAAERIVKEAGMDCINLKDQITEIGMQPDLDYEDKEHTNIHGALKITAYLTQFLEDSYGFHDHRDEDGWDAWDECAELYDAAVSPYVLDFERDFLPRDYSLSIPEITDVRPDGRSVILEWQASDGSPAGYFVYRKGADSWERIAAVEPDAESYTDTGLEPGEYTYTVVPFSGEEQEARCGNFNYTGRSIIIEGE